MDEQQNMQRFYLFTIIIIKCIELYATYTPGTR